MKIEPLRCRNLTLALLVSEDMKTLRAAPDAKESLPVLDHVSWTEDAALGDGLIAVDDRREDPLWVVETLDALEGVPNELKTRPGLSYSRNPYMNMRQI